MPPSTNGLLYEYFKYLTLGGTIGAPYTGVQANSSPNVALLVRPAIGKISAGEGFRCVKLRKFYAGCMTTNLEAEANVALGCGMTVEALDDEGKVISKNVFQYKPENPAVAPMQKYEVALPAASTIRITANILKTTTEYLLCLPFPVGFIVKLVSALAKLAGEVVTAGLFDNMEFSLYVTENECRTASLGLKM
jgi:hypothetical protein